MLALTYHMLSLTLKAKAESVLAPALVKVCNDALASNPTHTNVWVSAAKWTPKGNLVVFASPRVSCDALFATSHLLTAAIFRALPDDPKISSCLNVKWGKVINSVPTSVVEGHPHVHLPPTCWQVLIDNNPSLCHLKVCQLSSWVRCPSFFKPRLQSSLVLAFEDPDGMIMPSLIYAHHVYAFGAQCQVKAWKQPPFSPAKHKADQLARKLWGICSANAAQHQDALACTLPVSSAQMAAVTATGICLSAELVTAATFSDAGDKWTPPSPPQALKPLALLRKPRPARSIEARMPRASRPSPLFPPHNTPPQTFLFPH